MLFVIAVLLIAVVFCLLSIGKKILQLTQMVRAASDLNIERLEELEGHLGSLSSNVDSVLRRGGDYE